MNGFIDNLIPVERKYRVSDIIWGNGKS